MLTISTVVARPNTCSPLHESPSNRRGCPRRSHSSLPLHTQPPGEVLGLGTVLNPTIERCRGTQHHTCRHHAEYNHKPGHLGRASAEGSVRTHRSGDPRGVHTCVDRAVATTILVGAVPANAQLPCRSCNVRSSSLRCAADCSWKCASPRAKPSNWLPELLLVPLAKA